ASARPPFFPRETSARPHPAAPEPGHRATDRPAGPGPPAVAGLGGAARRDARFHLPARGRPTPLPARRLAGRGAAADRAVEWLPFDRGAPDERHAGPPAALRGGP